VDDRRLRRLFRRSVPADLDAVVSGVVRPRFWNSIFQICPTVLVAPFAPFAPFAADDALDCVVTVNGEPWALEF